jgi:phosphoglycolate phosphatase-like HAD superfamily hydrolase
LRTFDALTPNARHREVLGACEVSVDALRASKLYCDFVEMMPLGNRAEDFGVELAALADAVEIRDQAEYDAYFALQAPQFLDEFHAAFYRERRRFQECEPERWDSLVAPYSDFVSVLPELADRVVLTIATAKDGPSVSRCLKRYGVESLFPGDRVLDKEVGRDKRRHIELIRERCGVAFDEICFVDDKVNHLTGVAELGVRCVLASWGYNGPRERKLAAERGFEVCSLDRAVQTLTA